MDIINICSTSGEEYQEVEKFKIDKLGIKIKINNKENIIKFKNRIKT